MKRRQFLLATGVTAEAALSPGAASRRPTNIVYVMLNDLGYGDFGSYGQKRIRTPNADQFASKGLHFIDCYAGSTVDTRIRLSNPGSRGYSKAARFASSGIQGRS